jgi:hypothetical protein
VTVKDVDTMTTSSQRTDPLMTVVHGADRTPVFDEGDSWDRADWQRMWLRTRALEWQTLALVPGDDQTSTFEVAHLIASLGREHGESVQVADLRALRPRHVEAFLEGTRWEVGQGSRIVFATRSAAANFATVPLARGADCAVLCVSLGSSSLASIRNTVEQIGREHFLGSLIVRAGPSSARPAPPQRRAKTKARP